MHTSLNRLLLALLATIILAAGMVASTSAATQSRVNALGCARAGGQATVPAGTEVQVGEGNFLKNRGLTTDFRQMERTTIAINSDSPIDISSFWGAPFPVNFPPYGDIWGTRLTYDTGIVLGQGQSMHFQLVIAVPHPYIDGLTFVNGDSGQPLFFIGTEIDDCTVTGV